MIRRVRLDQRESKKSKKGDINKRAGFPPTREGDPDHDPTKVTAARFSPHTRGGSTPTPRAPQQQAVFPAHVGATQYCQQHTISRMNK